MTVFVLSGILVLALAGCACVVWASRGGPRWVRAVAAVTLGAGELVRRSGRTNRNSGSGDGSSGTLDG
ncbi:hypothetical protein GPZ77_19465 [Streptomyces sp. QHH-9511]|uniref:hypothetical protein n=1 Tax=Streptomyces sp. QHH-9511 TaxID=2684468 RepID=UPI0013175BE9|nr:hypothetical protein [Streptomyces sp. QHH-9511]QGZ50249.1 hypothetical protein GPZ77_19465 [Streptomyces sp. QHH-9511]